MRKMERKLEWLFLATFVLLLAGTVGSANADLLDDIKMKGEITIGTEAAFPPFEYMEKGKIVGYSSDLLAIIMEDLPAVKVNQLDIPWQGILPGLAAGKFDFIVTSVTATKERAERYALSIPIADATVALLVKKNAEIKFPNDLAGKVVGSQTGSAQLKALQGFAVELEKAGTPIKKIREYVSFDEAYADLAVGRIAAVAQSFPNLADAVKKRPGIFRVVTPPFGPKVFFSWAARNDKESKSLSNFFDEGLRKLNKSGKMKELQIKWFGFEMAVPSDALPAPVQ